MKGNIYTQQKCGICAGPLIHDERRGGCFCENHPTFAATKRFRVKFGSHIDRRKNSYLEATRLLNRLRAEDDDGTLDIRDHMASKPLSFYNLAGMYLAYKKKQKLKSYYHIECYMRRAAEFFKDRNVKTIRKVDFNAFADSLTKPARGKDGRKYQKPLSDKTKANYLSQIHDFYHEYLYGEIEAITLADLPKFPKIDYELGFRKIISVQEREDLLVKLKEKTIEKAPKLFLAVDMLTYYNKLRPGDLRTIKEGDIDLMYGIMTVWRPTKRKQKSIPRVLRIRLLAHHVNEIKRLKTEYPAMAAVPFFRHSGLTQAKKDTPFGINYLYKEWKKVCVACGYDDLDLYGATRHSTTTAIAMAMGKKKARLSSGHETNKAFDRYCQVDDEDSYGVTMNFAQMRGQVVSFDEENKRTGE